MLVIISILARVNVGRTVINGVITIVYFEASYRATGTKKAKRVALLAFYFLGLANNLTG